MPSSVISSFRYCDNTATLFITYLSGVVYEYKDVPLRVYEALSRAASKGTYLNKKIKGKFNYKRLPKA